MSDTSEAALPRRKPLALGRGLSALLGDVAPNPDVRRDGVQALPIAQVHGNPDQPRRQFDDAALDELAESIRKRGVLQPILVRRQGDGYQIIAGERRWRAAQRADLPEIPAIVRDYDDAETLEVALIENLQRTDLNAIDEGRAYERLIKQFGHTHDALGGLVNKARSHVTNQLRLLTLPERVQDHVVSGALSMGHARALVGVAEAEAIADDAVRNGLSVRAVEARARQTKSKVQTKSARLTPAGRDNDIMALEEHLAALLGIRVDVMPGDGGTGRVVLHYATLDQLDMVCQRLTGERV